jgi:hypothetical protein
MGKRRDRDAQVETWTPFEPMRDDVMYHDYEGIQFDESMHEECFGGLLPASPQHPGILYMRADRSSSQRTAERLRAAGLSFVDLRVVEWPGTLKQIESVVAPLARQFVSSRAAMWFALSPDGLGIVEFSPDATLDADRAALSASRQALVVSGYLALPRFYDALENASAQ